MWRGRDWKSSLPKPEDMANAAAELTTDSGDANSPNSCLVLHATSDLGIGKSSDAGDCPERHNQIISPSKDMGLEETKDILHVEKNNNHHPDAAHVGCNAIDVNGSCITSDSMRSSGPEMVINNGMAIASEEGHRPDKQSSPVLVGLETAFDSGQAVASEDGYGLYGPSPSVLGDLETSLKDEQGIDQLTPSTESSESRSSTGSSPACTEGVLLLWRQAIESGSALVLDDSIDANLVYEEAVALAKTAPPGPVFRNRFRKVVVQKTERTEHSVDLVADLPALEKRGGGKKISKGGKKISKGGRRKDLKYEYHDAIPQGSLGIDELAKLLAS